MITKSFQARIETRHCSIWIGDFPLKWKHNQLTSGWFNLCLNTLLMLTEITFNFLSTNDFIMLLFCHWYIFLQFRLHQTSTSWSLHVLIHMTRCDLNDRNEEADVDRSDPHVPNEKADEGRTDPPDQMLVVLTHIIQCWSYRPLWSNCGHSDQHNPMLAVLTHMILMRKPMFVARTARMGTLTSQLRALSWWRKQPPAAVSRSWLSPPWPHKQMTLVNMYKN